jgi:hypothetical protein
MIFITDNIFERDYNTVEFSSGISGFPFFIKCRSFLDRFLCKYVDKSIQVFAFFNFEKDNGERPLRRRSYPELMQAGTG